MHIKKGDNVAIIAGKDKGKEGKVLVSIPTDHRVIVEGINIQKRHTKPRSAQATGGILDKAGTIDVSNVMVICPKCKKATKVAMLVDGEGKKYRACKKAGCGENLDKKFEKAEKKIEKADKTVKAAAKKATTKAAAEKTETAKKPTAKKATAKKADSADKAE